MTAVATFYTRGHQWKQIWCPVYLHLLSATKPRTFSILPSGITRRFCGQQSMYIFMETDVNDYIHDVQLPTFHVIRQTFLTSYSSLYTRQPHQAHTCYSHAQTHTKDYIILAQCWIISFLKDYYGIYLVKWINTEVFFNCNVNIFTVSNTILYSLRIELETYFFF